LIFLSQILRILSKRLSEKVPTHDCYCISNTPRPLLSYGPKGYKSSRRTYLFVEALRRFRADWEGLDFTKVYKKAVPIYLGKFKLLIIIQGFTNYSILFLTGQLEHNFVVLKEDVGATLDKTSGANSVPIGGVKRSATSAFAHPHKRRL